MKNLIMVFVLCAVMFAGCEFKISRRIEVGPGRASETVTVPSLFGDGDATYRYEDMTPLQWAYCLDMTKGTSQEKETWKAFDKACEKDKTLFGKVGEYYQIKGAIKRAENRSRGVIRRR